MTILAIESSCDDTAASIVKDGVVLSNVIATQLVHKNTGGVVPEVASRAHLVQIVPVVKEALNQSGLQLHDVDMIAATQFPGLLGSLIVGFNFAKSLAQVLDKPLYGIHHMKAHILAHWAEDPKPHFPFLCLTVSGGHTQLVLMKSFDDMEILGATIDDAAGEAFDKAAKMLGLPYPGGPLIDKYAKDGNPNAFSFSMPEIQGFNYSFSGLKTSILYFLQKQIKENPEFIKENRNDLCASIQHTIITILIRKFKKAILKTGVKHIGIAGGVSANSGLRTAVTKLSQDLCITAHIPSFSFCTDNAAMIGIAAYYQHNEMTANSLDAAAQARVEW